MLLSLEEEITPPHFAISHCYITHLQHVIVSFDFRKSNIIIWNIQDILGNICKNYQHLSRICHCCLQNGIRNVAQKSSLWPSFCLQTQGRCGSLICLQASWRRHWLATDYIANAAPPRIWSIAVSSSGEKLR